ncbi:uncharacterized protein DNG_09513 [Cephalotrichum gorgonifer]|uniref:Extracellular membrane protein CFEM domain-containing protein n=1 Tax=Cephalotrichum gorgonifer TaxID=2041049 RepID=A0AAE8N714_9PEZI|nr:uncharacterized protein DNG_09513 [Cephalotrichum gorgonifer]
MSPRRMAVLTLMSTPLGLQLWPDPAPVNAVLLPRQTNTPDLIDPVTMPYCTWSNCWHFGSDPPDLCPLLDGPCPDNDDNSENGGRVCGTKQYARDCYCSLKTSLSCAWSCSWSDWWDTEDWFADRCAGSPAAQPLDFSPLPNCARDCIDDASFAYGCITGSTNCFCANGDLFECQNACSSEAEWVKIQEWLEDACEMEPDAARAALEEGTFTIGLPAPTSGTAVPTGTEGAEGRDFGPRPPLAAEPPTWDEITMFVILGITVLASLGFLVFTSLASRKRRTTENNVMSQADVSLVKTVG